MTEQTKSENIVGELEHKAPGFLRRNKIYLIGFFGILGLHIAWHRLNENYVPKEERTEKNMLRHLKNLDPLPRK